MEPVLFEVQEHVAVLTLNRPEVYNSVNQALSNRLLELLDTCEQDANIRCILIKGSGKGFCAGQDLAGAGLPTPENIGKIIDEQYNKIVTKLRTLPKPIVAAVHGTAAGAGANLALACDLCIAHEEAFFLQAFSKIGLIPDSGGTYFLPRTIGHQKAAGLMFLGDKISAPEADQMGMIFKCIPAANFETEVQQLTTRISQMPTAALSMIKEALNASIENSMQEQLELEKQLQMKAGATQDFQEGVMAFLQKRKPNFTGK